jgi:hypothetical protein
MSKLLSGLPVNIASNNFHYYVPFVDDHSRMTWLFLMQHRSDLLSIFQIFRKEVNTHFGQKIHTLRYDNAKEYLSQTFTTYLAEKGIVHQTCAYTSEQNKVAKRKNRHCSM